MRKKVCDLITQDINMDARTKLLRIMKKPDWYEGHFNPSTARGYKHKLEHNKEITDDKVREILKTLGIKPKQREVW